MDARAAVDAADRLTPVLQSRLAEIAGVPQQYRSRFAAHTHEIVSGVWYRAFAERSPHPMVAQNHRLRALATVLKSFEPADAQALAHALLVLGYNAASHDADGFVLRLAEAASLAARPKKGRTKTRLTLGDRVPGLDEDLSRRDFLNASEWFAFEAFRAARLNGGNLKLNRKTQKRAANTFVSFWEEILRCLPPGVDRPKADRLEHIKALAETDASASHGYPPR